MLLEGKTFLCLVFARYRQVGVFFRYSYSGIPNKSLSNWKILYLTVYILFCLLPTHARPSLKSYFYHITACYKHKPVPSLVVKSAGLRREASDCTPLKTLSATETMRRNHSSTQLAKRRHTSRWCLSRCIDDDYGQKLQGRPASDKPDLQRQDLHKSRHMECSDTISVWKDGPSATGKEHIQSGHTRPQQSKMD